MLSIYSIKEIYPHAAGSKEKGGCSEAAAKKITPKLKQLQREVLDALSCHSFGATAEQVAFWMNIPPETVKPRLSELKQLGKVRKTMRRGKTMLGGACAIWEVVCSE